MFECLNQWKNRDEDNNVQSLVKILDQFTKDGSIDKTCYAFLRKRCAAQLKTGVKRKGSGKISQYRNILRHFVRLTTYLDINRTGMRHTVHISFRDDMVHFQQI